MLPLYHDLVTRQYIPITPTQWFIDGLYLFDKTQKLVITAPRQSGKTTFITGVIGHKFHHYEEILVVAWNVTMSKELMNNTIKMVNDDGKYSFSKLSATKFSVANTVIDFKFNIDDDYFRGKSENSILVLIDEFMFRKDLEAIRTVLSQHPSVDFVLVSTFSPTNDVRSLLHRGHLFPQPYEYMNVSIREVKTDEEIKKMINNVGIDYWIESW